jgi:site-specific recombinase XerD
LAVWLGAAGKLKQELMEWLKKQKADKAPPVAAGVGTRVVATAQRVEGRTDTAAERERRVKEFISANQNKNTRKVYAFGWTGFERFLGRIGVAVSAVDGVVVADHLRERIGERGVAASTVSGDRAAIRDKFRHTAQQDVTEHPLVNGVMAITKVKATQSKPKKHMSAQLMREIIINHDDSCSPQPSGAALAKWQVEVWRAERNVCLMLVMMMGMLRESEAVALLIEDVSVKEDVIGDRAVKLLQIAIVQSKTDQAKNDAMVLLGPNDEEPNCCPVRRIQAYLQLRAQAMAVAGNEDKQFLFPTEKGERMSNVTPCGIVQRAVEKRNAEGGAWGDPMEYGSHSLRRGGVTAEDRMVSRCSTFSGMALVDGRASRYSPTSVSRRKNSWR